MTVAPKTNPACYKCSLDELSIASYLMCHKVSELPVKENSHYVIEALITRGRCHDGRCLSHGGWAGDERRHRVRGELHVWLELHMGKRELHRRAGKVVRQHLRLPILGKQRCMCRWKVGSQRRHQWQLERLHLVAL